MAGDILIAKESANSKGAKPAKRAKRKERGTTGSAPLRFVTAASLFDGHDASINIMRRILQSLGVEVIHLGHNRSVDDIVTAAIQEDVHAIAVSSYQGGHVEYFKYMLDLLKERGAEHVRVFGGGGGVIVREEIDELHAYGVTRIYAPEDGQKLGLQGMIADMAKAAAQDLLKSVPHAVDGVAQGDHGELARVISAIECDKVKPALLKQIRQRAKKASHVPVLGITGTGGAGKSSLTDELIRRLRHHSGEPRIAVIAIDPTKRKTGGALLGDRIRMNAIAAPNIYFRSLSTRGAVGEVPEYLSDVIAACKAGGFELVVVETPGIGQGDAGIVSYCDLSLYVMTPEFGAQSQLEKIDMLDFADAIAINKFDRKGAADALRDVSKQYQRNHELFAQAHEEMPVFGTIASRFADPGVTALYQRLLHVFEEKGFEAWPCDIEALDVRSSEPGTAIVPPQRQWYLAEVAETVRGYHRTIAEQVQIARERQQLREAKRMLEEAGDDTAALGRELERREKKIDKRAMRLLETWPEVREAYSGDDYVFKVRSKEQRVALTRESLSGSKIPRVALPAYEDDGEVLKWLLKENIPGKFPYTGGVFPFKRDNEDPTRMFAGEGDAFRTNKRFHYLSKESPAKRLSTAFDSVTLYGWDPDERPDIYGKVGNSGVSIATLDDMKALYDGFDLCDPSTSVSMTINGPAPTILAMFFNTAIDQQMERFRKDQGRDPDENEAASVRADALATVRGTVQADILKEDQGQNTCIFSTEFALRMMADIQQYFIDHSVQNFYSVSISG
ncbi:MAG: methylmalonyl-CoA mutase family protein, partial [Hyphomicrobiales bacterium]|nr:methylmalonyl-CoA mutase family protein [Hyphomicrobiales bacterium]